MWSSQQGQRDEEIFAKKCWKPLLQALQFTGSLKLHTDLKLQRGKFQIPLKGGYHFVSSWKTLQQEQVFVIISGCLAAVTSYLLDTAGVQRISVKPFFQFSGCIQPEMQLFGKLEELSCWFPQYCMVQSQLQNIHILVCAYPCEHQLSFVFGHCLNGYRIVSL